MKTLILTLSLLSTQLLAAQTFTAFWTAPDPSNSYIYFVQFGISPTNFSANYTTSQTSLIVPLSVLAKAPQPNYMQVSLINSNLPNTNSDGSFNLYDAAQPIVIYKFAGQVSAVKVK